MAIKVLFFASLVDITGVREAQLDPATFPDIESIFSKYAADFPRLESHRKSILYSLNSEFAHPHSPVHDGDEVAFFPPVSGG